MKHIRRDPSSRPTGVAVVMVLMVLAVTLGVCYAMFRSQSTSILIQENEQLQSLARQAALSGLRTALQKMHSPDWSGINSSLQVTVSQNQTCQVSYTAGDSLLSPSDPAYPESPYRVTILCTGTASDPNCPQRTVNHQIRTVVRLVARNFSITPTDWGVMQNYTTFQTHSEDVELDIPCQIRGRTRIQGKIYVARRYPTYLNAWWTYLEDLNTMRGVGYPDYRPVQGPVYLFPGKQEVLHYYALKVSCYSTPTSEVGADWSKPTLPTTYRLYPGGPVYTITQLPETLENVSYQPNLHENPLGIYYRDGSLELRNGVTIQGALYCRDTLRIQQSNVQIRPVVVPTLYQEGVNPTTPIRLPTLSCQNFYVSNTGGGEVEGLVAVFDRFQIDKGPENVAFTLTGRLIARKISIRERIPWDTLNWENLYNQYQSQKSSLPPAERYFPVWLARQGRSPAPRLVINPDVASVTYHWPRWDQPIFQPHPNDTTPLNPDKPALRWELVRWTESPNTSSVMQMLQQTKKTTLSGQKK